MGHFCRKSRNFSNFSETESTLPIAHCVSQLWRSFSANAFVGSVLFLLRCIGNVIDRSRIFRSTKIFRRRVFVKQLKTQVFSEGKFYFVALFWPQIPCMESKCFLCDVIWGVGCIQFLLNFLLIFPQCFGRKFSEKIGFSIMFLHYLKFCGCNVPKGMSMFLLVFFALMFSVLFSLLLLVLLLVRIILVSRLFFFQHHNEFGCCIIF